MSKTIHDAAYGALLAWLKSERARRNAETGGQCTMRAVAPRLARLLGRPGLKFTWVAKIEQRDRRIDLLEFVAYCAALGIDPHEGLDRLLGQVAVSTARTLYPQHVPAPAAYVAEPGAGPPAADKARKSRVRRGR